MTPTALTAHAALVLSLALAAGCNDSMRTYVPAADVYGDAGSAVHHDAGSAPRDAGNTSQLDAGAAPAPDAGAPAPAECTPAIVAAPTAAACAATTGTCLDACTTDACAQGCIGMDPAPDACFACIDDAFTSCVNANGCQAQYDALACCYDACPDPTAAGCDTSCAAQQSAYDACDAAVTACDDAPFVCFPA